MPYYHELALRSKPTTAEIIYCPGSYKEDYIVNAKSINSNDIGMLDTSSNNDKSNAISLGVAALNQSVSFNTSIEWSSMGSLGDVLIKGFVDTLKRNKRILLSALTGMHNISGFIGWAGGEETAQNVINSVESPLWSGQQVDFITNQGFTKSYSGSSNSIEIPTIELILYSESTKDNIIGRVKKIMSYLNPRVSSLINATKLASGNMSAEEKARRERTASAVDNLLKVEYAPGDYKTSGNTFNIKDMQNTFLVRLGYKYIPYCLPVGINIQMSKSGYIPDTGNGNWLPHYVRIAVQMQTAYRVLTQDIIRILESSRPHTLRS